MVFNIKGQRPKTNSHNMGNGIFKILSQSLGAGQASLTQVGGGGGQRLETFQPNLSPALHMPSFESRK